MFAKRLVNRISNSYMIVPITLLLSYAFYIAVLFFIEDYRANEAVYALEPIVKSTPALNGTMARFIQIAPAVFGYLFLANTNKRTYGYISLAFLVYDWGIGIYYRTNYFSLDLNWTIYAAVQDLIFFTAGSDILITLLASVLPGLYINSIKLISKDATNAIKEILAGVQPAENKQSAQRQIPYTQVGSAKRANRDKSGFKNVQTNAPPNWDEMFKE